jgi:predicted amidohydrolase
VPNSETVTDRAGRGCGAARRIRLRLIQVSYGDDESPADRLDRVSRQVAGQQDADLIVLPELWTAGGFACQHWAGRAEPLDGAFVSAMSAAARAAGATVHAGSFIERAGGRLYNTSVVLTPDGQVPATYRKVHRFGDGEKSLLEAGQATVAVPLTVRGHRVATMGLATCYDLRFPELFRDLVGQHCDLFVVPAAWPAARVDHWEVLGRARAIENQSFVVQCNTGGRHGGIAMGGRSQVVDPSGTVVGAAGDGPAGDGAGDAVVAVEIDMDAVTVLRRDFPALADRDPVCGRDHAESQLAQS